MDRCTGKESIDILGKGAVAAQESVGTEDPEVTSARRRGVRELAGARILDLTRAELGFEPGEKVVDLAGGEPHTFQRIFGA